MAGCLTPREVAGKTGFGIDTLRYYERVGLLAQSGGAHAGGQH
jgi:DNA-binding transcriptional MerR regulator